MTNLRNSVSVAALALAAGLATMSPAAAGGDTFKPAAPAAPAAYTTTNWGGLYGGLHIGAGEANWDGIFNNSDFSDSDVLIDRINTQGILGGGQVGFNWDRGKHVFGIEADVSFMDWADVAKAASGSEEVKGEVDALGSVRARIGVTVDDQRKMLLFATAGVAWIDADATVFSSGERVGGGFGFGIDDVGAVVGGGFEFAATDQFRFRVEGLYYFFDDSQAIIGPSEADPGDFVKFDDVVVFRVSGNWYFNSR